MISRLGLTISRVFQRIAPDPFVIAVLLTFATFALAWWLTGTSPADMVDYWSGSGPLDGSGKPMGDGVWDLLGFGMQMCLILVTGHALASSPPVSALLNRLAAMPRSAGAAVVMVAAVAVVLGVLNWGLGLIAGALLARRVGKAMAQRNVSVHYPLLAAAGYLGLLVWHGGFSGSAPLKVTTEGEITSILGADATLEPIALTETILSPMNLFITGGLLVICPLVMLLLSPRADSDMQLPGQFIDDGDDAKRLSRPSQPARSSDDRENDAGGESSTRAAIAPASGAAAKPIIPRLLEDTPLVSLMLVAVIGWWAWRYYIPAEAGAASGITSLTPNTVNLTMLMLGLLLHGTPARYVRAVDHAVRGCSGIILQFPLYAGIMAVMKHSGLTELLAEQIAATTSETTLPLATFASAGIVNLFVPSGGGQWAVQGPIAMQAALDSGVAPAKMVMSVAYGDQLTNMLQPFWALPLLAITGVKARDIVGYTAIVMLVAAVWITLGLLIF